MIIKWKTTRWHDAEILRVECTRETAQSVWALERPWSLDSSKQRPAFERRRVKDSGGEIYHDTWEAAHAHLMTKARKTRLTVCAGNLSARTATWATSRACASLRTPR